MAFHEGSFKQRLGAMGDLAEGVFEDVYQGGFAHYGLRRPPLNLAKVPIKVRYTPDMVTSHGLIEVMGLGKDQLLKLKCEKFEALIEWNSDWKVDLFIYDSANKRYCTVSLDDLSKIIVTGKAPRGTFNEGKDYWAVHADLMGEWTDYTGESNGLK